MSFLQFAKILTFFYSTNFFSYYFIYVHYFILSIQYFILSIQYNECISYLKHCKDSKSFFTAKFFCNYFSVDVFILLVFSIFFLLISPLFLLSSLQNPTVFPLLSPQISSIPINQLGQYTSSVIYSAYYPQFSSFSQLQVHSRIYP